MKVAAASMAVVLLIVLVISAFAQNGSQKQPFDQVTFYQNNCLGCHGSKAQKHFNPDLPEGQMVDAILNGLLMETPPDMPAFAEQGINEERAKALIAHMKSLKQ